MLTLRCDPPLSLRRPIARKWRWGCILEDSDRNLSYQEGDRALLPKVPFPRSTTNSQPLVTLILLSQVAEFKKHMKDEDIPKILVLDHPISYQPPFSSFYSLTQLRYLRTLSIIMTTSSVNSVRRPNSRFHIRALPESLFPLAPSYPFSPTLIVNRENHSSTIFLMRVSLLRSSKVSLIKQLPWSRVKLPS